MPILLTGVLLIVFGLFGMYSVSIFESFNYTRAIWDEPSNYFYFYAHLEKLLIGLGLCVIAYFTPLKRFKKLRYLIVLVSVIGMLLLFTSLGASFGQGAMLWLDLGGGTLQPGEFFKLGFIMFLADWLVRKKKFMSDHHYFFGFAVIVAIGLLIFLLLPDFGTLLILGPVALIMYWYGGGKGYYVLITLILGVMGVLMASLQFTYVQERLAYFIDSTVDEEHRGIGWQSRQAMIAVGGGGLIGKGYGKGLQKFGYLPEAQSDFIFAAFSEEIGFLGNVILVGLYCALGRLVLTRLGKVDDEYFKVLAMGMLALILVQALINIGVNIKLVPLTGVTLPFVSHGGSALIVNMLEITLLYKILYNK